MAPEPRQLEAALAEAAKARSVHWNTLAFQGLVTNFSSPQWKKP